MVTHLKFSVEKEQSVDREETNNVLSFQHALSKPAQKAEYPTMVNERSHPWRMVSLKHGTFFYYYLKYSQLKWILNDQGLGSKVPIFILFIHLYFHNFTSQIFLSTNLMF